jgi:hypothetical protein
VTADRSAADYNSSFPNDPWKLLTYYPAGEANGESWEDGVHVQPIIAFMLTSGGWMQPLVLEGLPLDDEETWGILRPDGQVEIIMDCVLDGVDAFKAEMRLRAGRTIVAGKKDDVAARRAQLKPVT